MKKTKIVFTIMAFILLTSCAKDVKDAFDSLECANLITRIDQDDNETCAEALADIDEIERSCGEFLSDASKELIASLRANCTDN